MSVDEGKQNIQPVKLLDLYAEKSFFGDVRFGIRVSFATFKAFDKFAGVTRAIKRLRMKLPNELNARKGALPGVSDLLLACGEKLPRVACTRGQA